MNLDTNAASLSSIEALRRAGNATRIPVIRPNPPRLSEHARELAQIESNGIYTNYGPVNTRFEQELVTSIFRRGHCLTVCNATIGLMMAIRDVVGESAPTPRRYALMPSFTFAAAAQAALWCGLTPLLCDVDPETWLPDRESEESLLDQYKGQVAVVVPYATFGNNLDLPRYLALADRYSVPIVVDAAASLGSIDADGKAFGSGFPWPVVFSMHATKSFSVGEGGIIYSDDPQQISRLRSMGSFGFEQTRSATMLGLNSKLTEVAALTGLLQIQEFAGVVQRRAALASLYAIQLENAFDSQRLSGQHKACAFQSILLPRHLAPSRRVLIEKLQSMGIGAATYFSPHLAQQPYIQKRAVYGSLAVTEDIASRVLTLPLFDGMTSQQVTLVVACLRHVLSEFGSSWMKPAAMPDVVPAWNAVPEMMMEAGR